MDDVGCFTLAKIVLARGCVSQRYFVMLAVPSKNLKVCDIFSCENAFSLGISHFANF